MRVAYLCNTFGQPDHDRCSAMGAAGLEVLSIDWARQDTEYLWEDTAKDWAGHLTLSVAGGVLAQGEPLGRLISALWRFRPQVVIVYGYHNPAFFLCAALAALCGVTLLTMNDSRFRDYDRSASLDFGKQIMLAPYRGCMAGSRDAAAYARFLGVRRVETYNCAINTARVGAASRPAFERTPFADRTFLVVSRFVEKKNLFRLLDAFEAYAARAEATRRLVLVGYGPLEQQLRDRVAASPVLSARTDVVGYVEVSRVPSYLGAALCLILPSVSDQFGIVVAEALASAVPVIVSSNCGAADLVRPWRNGYVIDPEQTETLTRAMIEIDGDEAGWIGMSRAAQASAGPADVSRFLAAMRSLLPARLQAAMPA